MRNNWLCAVDVFCVLFWCCVMKSLMTSWFQNKGIKWVWLTLLCFLSVKASLLTFFVKRHCLVEMIALKVATFFLCIFDYEKIWIISTPFSLNNIQRTLNIRNEIILKSRKWFSRKRGTLDNSSSVKHD